jgi:hypothetical protein
MPDKRSEIHETSVLFWFYNNRSNNTKNLNKIFNLFSNFACKQTDNKVNISQEDFTKFNDTFLRAQKLAKLLKDKLKLKGSELRWVAMDNNKSDSADIIIDNKKISLKDHSNIVRNNGFEQLLKTYCKVPVKVFKDPYQVFAPKLCSSYLKVVIKANFKLEKLIIKQEHLCLDGNIISKFQGTPEDFEKYNLKKITDIFQPKYLKEMVKNFSSSSEFHEQLFNIRTKIVSDVSIKVIATLKEGFKADKKHVENEFKKLLQFTEELKYFGYSSPKLYHVGVIVDEKKVKLKLKNITKGTKQLPLKTNGLQINLYTELQIKIDDEETEEVIINHQLRYKHRTFSCAPEANTHLTNASDWKKIYPSIKELI